jgi:hypothetical protein
MSKRLTLRAGFWSFVVCTTALAAAAERAPEKERFVRLLRGADNSPVALQTAIVRFSKEANSVAPTVDLIGAIHVADRSYYKELNRRFRDYDAVLYELVAPEEATVPAPGQSPGSAVGGLQVGMKSLLELEFQLDWVDYRPENMVHADMSTVEFRETMKRRKESFLGMFFRLMGRAMAEQSEGPVGSTDWKILAAMFAPDRAHRLKLIMAEEFSDMEGEMSIFEGPEGSTIITERNKKALRVLREKLAKGHRKLAIFYGAGHLPDLQQRLEHEFGMRPTKTIWLTDWSLTPEKTRQEAGT